MSNHLSPLTLFVGIGLLVTLATPSFAGVDDLRITEVRTDTGAVEITHMSSSSFSCPEVQFCHSFTYGVLISNGTSFAANERKTFTINGMNASDTDLWIYKNISGAGSFGSASNLIHGLKWGPNPNVGRTSLATGAGKWSGNTDFVPAPATGQSVVNETGSFDAADWYVDGSPNVGGANNGSIGSVSASLAWPAGTQDLEGVTLGDDVQAITGWTIVNTGAADDFTTRIVGDASSTTNLPNGETKWVRIDDRDAAANQNRFYSGPVTATGTPDGYTWTFYVLLEELPPTNAANVPRLTIQHDDGSGFSNAWGIEISRTNVSLVVTGIGGTAASSSLGMVSTTSWIKLDITADFSNSEVFASLNNGPATTLPTNLAAGANANRFRFCYRGEGIDNTVRMLLDAVSVAEYTAPVNIAPVITVEQDFQTNPTNIAQNATLMVSHNTTLADLDLRIIASDANGDPLSLSATVSNLGTTGILAAQFGTGGASVGSP